MPAVSLRTDSSRKLMDPSPTVGERASEPSDVASMGERLAKVRGMSVLEMRDTLAENARSVFAFAGIDTIFGVAPP